MADTQKEITCPACGSPMTKIFLAEKGVNIDICDKGCGGLAYYICNHSWVYNTDHSYYHGKCFVRVYNCTYTGFKCEFCDHIQSAGSLNLSGAHLCHYIHSSCGAGALRYCKEGQYI